ncbi:MAG: hypothetical protein U1F46_10805 [Marinagarivorans sp.]
MGGVLFAEIGNACNRRLHTGQEACPDEGFGPHIRSSRVELPLTKMKCAAGVISLESAGVGAIAAG